MKTYTLNNLPPAIATQFAKVRCAIAGGHTLRFHYPKSEGSGVGFRLAKPHKMMVGGQGQWLVVCFDIVKKATRHFVVAKMLNVSLPKGVEVGEQFFREADMPAPILTENIPPNPERPVAGCGDSGSSVVPPGSHATCEFNPSRPGGAEKKSSGASPAEPPADHSYGTAARGMGLPVTGNNSTFSVLPTLAGSRNSHDLDRENNQQLTEALCRHAGESPEPDCGVSPAASAAMPAAEVPFSMPPSASPADNMPKADTVKANAIRVLVRGALPHLLAGKTLTETASAMNVRLGKLSLALSLNGRINPVLSMVERANVVLKLEDHQLAPAPRSKKQDPWLALLEDHPAVEKHMFWLYFQTLKASSEYMTHERRTGTMSGTLLRLGDFDGLKSVAPEMAAQLRDGAQPVALMRKLQAITPGQEARARGVRHTQLHTVTGRRSLEIELEDGTKLPVEPGKVWVFDDHSGNWPHWFELPPDQRRSLPGLASHPMVARHGVGIGRQTLAGMDVGSGAVIGSMKLGRVRDAYTSALILRFLRQLMTQYGKPDWIIFERGIWASKKIKGWCTDDEDYAEQPFAAPAWTDEQQTLLQDGLEALGVRLHYCDSAHGPGKALIEGAFRKHQQYFGTFLEPGEGVNIGSHAGEFERAAKRMAQARDGVRHARDLGFLHIERAAAVDWDCWDWWNNKPLESRDDRKPLELLSAAPSNPPLTQDDLAVFLPESRPATIRGGSVWPSVSGQTYQFMSPTLFAQLGSGYSVEIKFDPAAPELGAAVYNRERGARNHQGFAPGALLGWAQCMDKAPLLSLRDRKNDPAVQAIEQYRRAERTTFRGYDLKTLKTVKASDVRDGRGSVPDAVNELPSPSAPPAARPQRVRTDVAALILAEAASRQSAELVDAEW